MDSTFYLDNLISQCDDLGMFREEILPKMPDMRQRWMNVIRQILDERGYSKTELAALCGVSRPAVAKWCSGALPSNREDYLRIGFAAGAGFAVDTNVLTLITPDELKELPLLSKDAAADALLDEIVRRMK